MLFGSDGSREQREIDIDISNRTSKRSISENQILLAPAITPRVLSIFLGNSKKKTTPAVIQMRTDRANDQPLEVETGQRRCADKQQSWCYGICIR
jgi:hypothetical protein